ncbi:MAG: ADP-ribosylglycohydrolase family protein [bacterium]
MAYFADLHAAASTLVAWLDLRHEQECDVEPYARDAVRRLETVRRKVEKLGPPPELAEREPLELEAIRELRPRGRRSLALDLSDAALRDRMLGAWLGRAAGCILGIPCEGMAKHAIRAAAKAFAMRYPLDDYWALDPKPGNAEGKHYGLTPRRKFLKGHIDRIGTDDDLTYTLLGLLILEDYGIDFTAQHVGQAWLRYLPMACTAERVALDNLREGLRPPETALARNPYREWIGADIRSDPWGYAAPGLPQVAATFAYRDASVSHRRTGVYGAMFFSAAIAAAFALDDVGEVLRAGLHEIPRDCRLAKTVRQTIRWCAQDGEWDKTTDRILERTQGMAGVHTLNNAALTVAGLIYGRGDYQKTIALTVMGGLDTDCTGATAGSIVGAMRGAGRLPRKWVEPLGDRAESYIQGHRRWRSSDVARRFCRVAAQVRDLWA